MASTVKYIYGTEAQILALTPESPNWIEKAFYYPDDKTYFYQAVSGTMKKYGDSDIASGGGTGVNLNGLVLGGVKAVIESTDILNIPEFHEYNTHRLSVDGTINCDGEINIF